MCFSSIDWTVVQPIAKDFFVPLAGAAAGAWATLHVYREQSRKQAADIAKSIWEDNLKQDNQAGRNLSHFVWLLEDLIDFAGKQNQDYQNMASELEKEPLRQHQFIIRASGTLTRILNLKQDDIFFSFIRKALDTDENREHVASVYKNVDLIKQLIESVKYKYDGHLEAYDQMGSEYREVIEEVRDLIIERTTNARKSFSIWLDPLALYLAESSRNFLDALTTIDDASSLAWQHEHFLWPVQKTLVQEFEHDERMKEIVNRGRRGLILIGRLKHEAETTVTSLKRDSATLGGAIKDLQKEVNYIKAVLISTKPDTQELPQG